MNSHQNVPIQTLKWLSQTSQNASWQQVPLPIVVTRVNRFSLWNVQARGDGRSNALTGGPGGQEPSAGARTYPDEFWWQRWHMAQDGLFAGQVPTIFLCSGAQITSLFTCKSALPSRGGGKSFPAALLFWSCFSPAFLHQGNLAW